MLKNEVHKAQQNNRLAVIKRWWLRQMLKKQFGDPCFLPEEILNEILTYLPDQSPLTPDEMQFLWNNTNELRKIIFEYYDDHSQRGLLENKWREIINRLDKIWAKVDTELTGSQFSRRQLVKSPFQKNYRYYHNTWRHYTILGHNLKRQEKELFLSFVLPLLYFFCLFYFNYYLKKKNSEKPKDEITAFWKEWREGKKAWRKERRRAKKIREKSLSS